MMTNLFVPSFKRIERYSREIQENQELDVVFVWIGDVLDFRKTLRRFEIENF